MADQAELAFVKNFINILGSAPVQYPDDYQQPPQDWLKKIPILPIALPKPPERVQPQASTSTSITVTFKSIKPPKSYSLSVSPTDSISSIKAQLAAEATAPPADAQRLLLKGKALADNKLLQEYSVHDGDTINLMIKPGHSWDPSAPPTIRTPPSDSSMQIDTGATKRAHSRVPSVVLSPSPSGALGAGEEKPVDILLSLDTSSIPTPSLSPEASSSTYHDTISNPEFWQKLLDFLRSEFPNYDDAVQAWEDFLRVSKGTLTPGQIAKIRDHVGVVGMAGT
ncbi:ubiquitin-like protein [Heliocybe sulcata]|uniref:Ubiquitin-like protein n=1 Tax=Heliocybe sulcata TaxID=5364 RepID=A0A5C3MVZ8_9AGAM|nr:ubiquitin-like protein [Heliocybe sulcata]